MIAMVLALALSGPLALQADASATDHASYVQLQKSDSKPSVKRLVLELSAAGALDWAMTEVNVRQPGIVEINGLGQSSLARAALTGVYVTAGTLLIREAYEVSPLFGKIVRGVFIGFKLALFAWNAHVLASD